MFHSIYDDLQAAAGKYAEFTALVCRDSKVSYPQLLKNIDRISLSLAEFCGAGDIISIMSTNCLEAVYVIYAANKLGATVCMIPPDAGQKNIANALMKTESKILFVGPGMLRPELSNQFAGMVSKIVLFPNTAKKNIFSSLKSRLSRQDSFILNWEQFLSHREKNHKFPQVEENSTAVILCSGGTDGLRKLVEISNANMYSQISKIHDGEDFVEGSLMLCGVPIYHGFGLTTCLHPMLCTGIGCALAHKIMPAAYSKLMETHRCKYAITVPSVMRNWVKTFPNDKNVGYIDSIYIGGDGVTPEDFAAVNEWLARNGSNGKVFAGYGLTETCAAMAFTMPGSYNTASVGFPLSGISVRTIDPETGEDCHGIPGELLVSGGTVMKGYYNDPEATADALETDENGNVWLHTGDVLLIGDDGQLYFKDRIKRMVVISGNNVFPAAVQHEINTCSVVDTSVVVPYFDGNVQKLKAVVKLKPGFTEAEARGELLAFCREHLDAFSIPSLIEFTDEIELTPMGKINYRAY